MIRNRLMQILASALLVLCLGFSSQAQTIAEQLDFLFAPLDKSRITTGMLIERGLFPHSPMPFNGTLTDSSYYCNLNILSFGNLLIDFLKTFPKFIF